MGKTLTVVALVAGAGLAVYWWLPTPAAPAATPAPSAEPAERSRPTPERAETPSSDSGGAVTADGAGGEPPIADLDPEEARRRQRLMELEQAADQRFEETVELDGLRAEAVPPSVRDLFQTMTLEPHFDLDQATEGYVDGMRIAELSGANPLAKAGFRAGDRLTRWNGQPLVDPAQIAYAMLSLGEEFEVCAEREGGDYCRIVSLGNG